MNNTIAICSFVRIRLDFIRFLGVLIEVIGGGIHCLHLFFHFELRWVFTPDRQGAWLIYEVFFFQIWMWPMEYWNIMLFFRLESLQCSNFQHFRWARKFRFTSWNLNGFINVFIRIVLKMNFHSIFFFAPHLWMICNFSCKFEFHIMKSEGQVE